MDNQTTLADEILLIRRQVRDERAFEALADLRRGKLLAPKLQIELRIRRHERWCRE